MSENLPFVPDTMFSRVHILVDGVFTYENIAFKFKGKSRNLLVINSIL